MSIGAAMLSAPHAGCHAHDPEGGGDAFGDGGADGDADSDMVEDSGGGSDPDCDPSAISVIRSETSPVIATVGIIEWSTAMNPVLSASIEFGLDTHYGYTAPVDLNEASYRTLLLGMKPSSIYHYRIVVNGCEGPDHTIETGAQPENLPDKTTSIQDSTSSAGGFIVASTGMKSNYAYILDRDGNYVWWYSFKPDGNSERMDGIGRAKMSADGKSMWGGTINVACDCGYLFGIAMDGLGTQETIAVDRHHDFTVLPDNTIVYIEYTDDGDRIVERSESGETRTVYNLNSDFSGSGIDWSHCNAIHYYPRDDSYTVSCLNLKNIIKIDRASGTLVWNLQGDSGGDFSGASWSGQHGHQFLENGNILIFCNGFSNVSGSEALELSLDLSSGTADETWRYVSGTSSSALGDVQRISNGNTLVVYSSDGAIHEVAPSKALVRSISVDGLGYADWRPTLYGEPCRY